MNSDPQPSLASSDAPIVILFDGHCGMCRQSRAWSAKLDWLGKVSWANFRDPEVRASVPQLTDEQLEQEMWAITPDGKMRAGFAAWRYMLTLFPLTVLPSLLLFLPLVLFVGRRIYHAIARRRSLACELQPTPSSGPWRQTLQLARIQNAEKH